MAMEIDEPSVEPKAPASNRIDAGSDEELRTWADRLGTSPTQIREAVKVVGDLASDVELHLKGSRSTTNDDQIEAAK